MLPLFKKEENECENDFERWIYILKNMSTFERMPFLARNAVFKKLSEIADISALSKDERDKYDESIKRMRDAISLMTTAKNEGREEGREEGRIEGERSGRTHLLTLISQMSAGEDADKVTQLTDPEVLEAMMKKYGIE